MLERVGPPPYSAWFWLKSESIAFSRIGCKTLPIPTVSFLQLFQLQSQALATNKLPVSGFKALPTFFFF